MLSLLEDVKKQVPRSYDAQAFAKFLAFAEASSDDSEFSEDNSSAREFADLLEDLINKSKDQIKNDPELERRLKFLLTKLRWLTPLSLNSKPLLQIMLAGTLVVAIKNGWEPFDKIQDWLYFNEFGAETNKEARAQALSALYSNNESIGTGSIELNTNQSVAPTVQNWLKDYLSSLPKTQDVSGSFDKVNYFTNSSNVKKLSEADRRILSQVVGIHRFLKNPDERVLRSAGPVRDIPRSIVPPAPPKRAFAPVPPVVKPAPVSSFDQKLSQISTPAPAHGEGLEALRQRMQTSKISFEPGPQAKSPAIVAPKPIAPAVPGVKMTPQEIKREVSTPELKAPAMVKPPAVIKPVEPPKPLETDPFGMNSRNANEPVLKLRNPEGKPGFVSTPSVRPSISSKQPASALAGIQVVEDLKKIEVGHLRQGPIQTQIQLIKSKIVSLAQANRLLPYYTVLAFEASPLFKAYLKHGSDKVQGLDSREDLNQAEFEAIADLRKDIERL